MSEEQGYSEEKDGVFGKYTEHKNKDGETTGYSEKKDGVFCPHIEHTNIDGKTTGYSEDKEWPFGKYTEHTSTDGDTVGYSERKDGVFGPYVEHTDPSNRTTGWSEQTESVFGRYTEHHGHSHHTSEPDSETHSASQRTSGHGSYACGSGSYSPSSWALGTLGALTLLAPFLLVGGVLRPLWIIIRFLIIMVTPNQPVYGHLGRVWKESTQPIVSPSFERCKLAVVILLFGVTPLVLAAIYLTPVVQSIFADRQKPLEIQIAVIEEGDYSAWKVKCNPQRSADAKCYASNDGWEIQCEMVQLGGINGKSPFCSSKKGDAKGNTVEMNASKRGFHIYASVTNDDSSLRVNDGPLFFYHYGETSGDWLKQDKKGNRYGFESDIIAYMIRGGIVEIRYKVANGQVEEYKIQLGDFSKMYSVFEGVYKEYSHTKGHLVDIGKSGD